MKIISAALFFYFIQLGGFASWAAGPETQPPDGRIGVAAAIHDQVSVAASPARAAA